MCPQKNSPDLLLSGTYFGTFVQLRNMLYQTSYIYFRKMIVNHRAHEGNCMSDVLILKRVDTESYYQDM